MIDLQMIQWKIPIRGPSFPDPNPSGHVPTSAERSLEEFNPVAFSSLAIFLSEDFFFDSDAS
jgi:hypothetical protein